MPEATPHCENCGRSTHWPVSKCEVCVDGISLGGGLKIDPAVIKRLRQDSAVLGVDKAIDVYIVAMKKKWGADWEGIRANIKMVLEL